MLYIQTQVLISYFSSAVWNVDRKLKLSDISHLSYDLLEASFFNSCFNLFNERQVVLRLNLSISIEFTFDLSCTVRVFKKWVPLY